jgi:L-threonylcarbamoyladenylate synthase
MKYKHYSPNADVVLVDGDDARFADYVRAHITDAEAVASADSSADHFNFCNRLSCGKTANADEASRALFSILREADDRGYTRLYIQLPPAEGRYLALYNRLIRAAGGRIVHIK